MIHLAEQKLRLTNYESLVHLLDWQQIVAVVVL